MSIIFDANTRVVISGIDSAMAQRQCREMLANGTRLIGAIRGELLPGNRTVTEATI